MEFDYLPILIASLILLVSFAFFFVYRRKTARKGILITGLCNSGKTLLFSQLVHGKQVQTQTSMKENHATFNMKSGCLELYDIPGYERLRNKYLDLYKSQAKGVVFVIDSSTIQKDIRDVAEYLYTILSDLIICKGLTYLLIACNKQDLPLAKSSEVICIMLEKELNALRVTKSSQLESVDPKGNKTRFLGNKDENFTFKSLGSIKVVLIDTSATDDNLNLVQKWLEMIA